MTQANNLAQKVERLENDMIDLKLATSSLIETVNIHQTNFEAAQRNFQVMQRNIESMQRNFESMQRNFETMQQEIRGIRNENRNILDLLLNQNQQPPESQN